MKKLTHLFFLAVISIPLSGYAHSVKTHEARQAIEVRYNKNVELLGFVYFIGYEGNQLENEKDTLVRNRGITKYAYGYDLYQQYKQYEKSENLGIIIGFAQNIWLDDFINLLLQLDDFPKARLTDAIEQKYYIRFSEKKDPAEARKNAVACIEAFNALYKEVNFDKYLKQNSSKYDNAIEQIKRRLPAASFIPDMESFYKQQFHSYTLIPTLTIPAGMGFGARYSQQNKTHIFNVFGARGQQSFKDESQLDMGFADEKQIRELSTHEFGHSFVNPVIDQLPEELITQTEKLFEPISNEMNKQNYTNWKSCVYEHFVRAGEVLIARKLGNTREAEELQKDYIENRKFIYLPVIIKELEAYSKNQTMPYIDAARNALHQLSKQTQPVSGGAPLK